MSSTVRILVVDDKEGANAYLNKPCHLEDIQSKIERALDVKKHEGSLTISRV